MTCASILVVSPVPVSVSWLLCVVWVVSLSLLNRLRFESQPKIRCLHTWPAGQPVLSQPRVQAPLLPKPLMSLTSN